jgi:hypothetical protein
MIDHFHQTPWVRLRHVRTLLDWHVARLITQCELAIDLVPDAMLTDRKALAVCLAEELRSVSHIMTDTLESQWQASWEKAMAGKFIDLPSLQN